MAEEKISAEEAKELWDLARVIYDVDNKKIVRADSMHELRKKLSVLAPKWQAVKE